MIEKADKEILQKAIYVNGQQMQAIVSMEECAELIQAVSKCMRYHDVESRTNAIEEMADVLICIEQLKIILNVCDEEINRDIHAKVLRFDERLKNGDKR